MFLVLRVCRLLLGLVLFEGGVESPNLGFASFCGWKIKRWLRGLVRCFFQKINPSLRRCFVLLVNILLILS